MPKTTLLQGWGGGGEDKHSSCRILFPPPGIEPRVLGGESAESYSLDPLGFPWPASLSCKYRKPLAFGEENIRSVLRHLTWPPCD